MLVALAVIVVLALVLCVLWSEYGTTKEAYKSAVARGQSLEAKIERMEHSEALRRRDYAESIAALTECQRVRDEKQGRIRQLTAALNTPVAVSTETCIPGAAHIGIINYAPRPIAAPDIINAKPATDPVATPRRSHHAKADIIVTTTGEVRKRGADGRFEAVKPELSRETMVQHARSRISEQIRKPTVHVVVAKGKKTKGAKTK